METMFSLGIQPSIAGALVWALYKKTQYITRCRGNHYHSKLCRPLMYHKGSSQKLAYGLSLGQRVKNQVFQVEKKRERERKEREDQRPVYNNF
jgi:hypothetical protein